LAIHNYPNGFDWQELAHEMKDELFTIRRECDERPGAPNWIVRSIADSALRKFDKWIAGQKQKP